MKWNVKIISNENVISFFDTYFLRRISLYEEIRWKEIIVFLIYNFENKFICGKILDIDIVYKLEKNIGVILG